MYELARRRIRFSDFLNLPNPYVSMPTTRRLDGQVSVLLLVLEHL